MEVNEYFELAHLAIKYHNESLLDFYRKYHDIKNSDVSTKNGTRVKYKIIGVCTEVDHSDEIKSTYHKDPEHKGSFVTTKIINKVSISTKIRYYSEQETFFTVARHENSRIVGTVGTIVGGSPTFEFGKDKRMFWVDMLDKDEHFNLSMNETMLSYNTYLVMRELYPLVPNGTVLKVKELFNE